MKKFLKWAAIVIVALIVIGAIFGKKKPAATAVSAESSQPAEAKAEPSAPVEETIKVNASDLFADYSSNEVSADTKYKGKALVVSGVVGSISKDAFGKIYVALGTGDPLAAVHANGVPEGFAAGLKKGQKVVLKCRGNGLILTSPMLSDCTPA